MSFILATAAAPQRWRRRRPRRKSSGDPPRGARLLGRRGRAGASGARSRPGSIGSAPAAPRSAPHLPRRRYALPRPNFAGIFPSDSRPLLRAGERFQGEEPRGREAAMQQLAGDISAGQTRWGEGQLGFSGAPTRSTQFRRGRDTQGWRRLSLTPGAPRGGIISERVR